MGISYAYYPGCSLTASAVDYDISFRAVAKAIGVELIEIPDWNCCGASSGFVVDPKAAAAWCARMLAFCEEKGLDMIVPCTGCLKNMHKAQAKIKADDEVKKYVADAVGRVVEGRTRCIHPLEALVVDVGLERIKEKIARPLKSLNIAPYYGCYIVRPAVEYDNVEDPQSMDNLVRLCGGSPVDIPFKTKCCGGGTFLTSEETALDLTLRIANQARAASADAMLVGCPLCDMLLDAYQAKLDKRRGEPLGMPILYFTQLLGLALGLSPAQVALEKRFVSANPVLAKLEAAEAEAARKEAERKAEQAARDKTKAETAQPTA